MAPHSSTLAWKIPWMEEPGRLQSMGSLTVGTTERLHFHFSLSCIGEGNGNPLQCSCLENPRDGGVWWAAVYGVAQSQTWLKWLNSSGSSWDVFNKIRETKGIFHAKIGTIQGRKDMGLTEAEDTKKRWPEYTKELNKKKILMTQITTMVWSLTKNQTLRSVKSSEP